MVTQFLYRLGENSLSGISAVFVKEDIRKTKMFKVLQTLSIVT